MEALMSKSKKRDKLDQVKVSIEEDIERSDQVEIVFCVDKESYWTDLQDQMRTEILSIPRNIRSNDQLIKRICHSLVTCDVQINAQEYFQMNEGRRGSSR